MTVKAFGTPGPRSIFPEMCNSRSLARCGVLANALWPRILVCCDDQGRMAGSAGDVLGECFPKMLARVKLRDIEAALEELSAERMVRIYEAQGEQYLQVVAWWRWQHYAKRAYPSRFPAPEGWTDYVYGRIGDEIATYREAVGKEPRKRKDVVPDEPDLGDWPAPDEPHGDDYVAAPGPQDGAKVTPRWRQGDASVAPAWRHDMDPPARARFGPVPSGPIPSLDSPKPPDKLGASVKKTRASGANPRATGDSPRQRSQAVKDGVLAAYLELHPDAHGMPGSKARAEDRETDGDDDWTQGAIR